MKGFKTILGGLVVLIGGFVACGGSDKSVPDSLERLRLTSDLFAAATTLRIEAHEVHQWPDPSGDWAKFEGDRQVTVWKPNGMRENLKGSGARELDHDLYYNGSILTLENHIDKAWAWAEVPETLDEMLDEVSWRFDLPLPLADFLYSSPYDAVITDDTESRYIGQEVVEGRSCDHFAFQQRAVDWEIWIETGENPLPCRLDIIHTDMEGPPRSRIFFTRIDLKPIVDDTIFSFEPKEGYREVPVVEKPKSADDGKKTDADAGGNGQ